MQIAGHDIGICSWSLKTKDTAELVDVMKQVGLEHLQLALGPLLRMDESAQRAEAKRLSDAGLVITGGMIGFPGESYSTIASIRETGGFAPDAEWPKRKEMTIAAGQLAAKLGLKHVTAHIGFVPPSNQESYKTMVNRVNELAAAFGVAGIELGMETGQETAPELLQFLNDLDQRNVFVNFDPANMILYGAGDPFEAIQVLGRHIRHVHVKDATLSDQPGTKWGTEVPFGQGEVEPKRFLDALHEVGYTGPLVIEREAGEDRVADIRAGIETLRKAAS